MSISSSCSLFVDERTHPTRILIVEDERVVAMGLRRQLEALGYEVVGLATAGEEAVRKAGVERPDLVLMDIHLEGVMDGIEAATIIRDQLQVPVVYLTAFSSKDVLDRAKVSDPFGYVLKPYDDHDLQVAIEMALHKHGAERDYRNRERSFRTSMEQALQQEHSLARTLAESFLCAAPENIPGLRVETAYEPASAVELIGGDFLDFIPLGKQHLGIVIGDVCGKGLPAAAFTSVCRHILRAYALEDFSPKTVLTRLNRALCVQTTSECAFVTLIYGVLDLQTFDFTYANAGHPSAVVWDPIRQNCQFLTETGGMLGVVPEWVWTSEALRLEPGGALVLFTDGIVEARRGRELFGIARVEAAVRELLVHGQNVAAGLKEEARKFAGGMLKDDVAVAAVRRR